MCALPVVTARRWGGLSPELPDQWQRDYQALDAQFTLSALELGRKVDAQNQHMSALLGLGLKLNALALKAAGQRFLAAVHVDLSQPGRCSLLSVSGLLAGQAAQAAAAAPAAASARPSSDGRAPPAVAPVPKPAPASAAAVAAPARATAAATPYQLGVAAGAAGHLPTQGAPTAGRSEQPLAQLQAPSHTHFVQG